MPNFGVWEWLVILIICLVPVGLVSGVIVLVLFLTKGGTTRQLLRQTTRNIASQDIMAMLEQTATAIATQPARQWSGWVQYLMEVLEGKVDGETYREVLERIRDRITSRLEAGRW